MKQSFLSRTQPWAKATAIGAALMVTPLMHALAQTNA